MTAGPMLIAEDLLLLLTDDEKGTMAAATYARPAMGGALLVELALAGLVEVRQRSSVWRTTAVEAVPGGAPADPLLVEALATVTARPRSPQDLVQRLGKGTRERLLERLEERGVLERSSERVLGFIRYTTWPAVDTAHEAQVRERLRGVLVHGLDADPRTAALVALLAAVDQAHRVVERDGLPARQIKQRAKEVAKGSWAGKAVQDAVLATQTAVTTAIAASTAAAAAGG